MTIGERSLNPIADKVIVRAIATTQLLASLGGFLTVPLVFLYGGVYLLTDAELREWSDAVDEYHQKVEAGETQRKSFPPENAM
jgi:hypothetical protein